MKKQFNFIKIKQLNFYLIISWKILIKMFVQEEFKKNSSDRNESSHMRQLQYESKISSSNNCYDLSNYIPSNHFNQYLSYLYPDEIQQKNDGNQIKNNFMQKKQPEIAEIKKVLKESSIIYNNSAPFQKQLQIVVIKSYSDCNLICAKWGRISMEISLYRMYFNSKDIHNTQILGRGCYSRIFSLDYNNKNYAIKSVLLNPKTVKQQVKSSELIYAISEYFISRIGSCLQIGPKLQNLFGFDIIVYNDCAQFAMQLCYKIEYSEENQQYIQRELKQNVKKLHLLNICHSDIKPENVLQSPTYQKPVLIDFGLSAFFCESIGYKSYTNFVGTYLFCSDQMKSIYTAKRKDYIDMYFNDTVCLKESIRKSMVSIKAKSYDWFKNESAKSKNQSINEIYDKLSCNAQYLVNFYQVKRHIFYSDYNSALKMMGKQKKIRKTMNKIFFIQFSLQKIAEIDQNIYKSTIKKMRKFTKGQKIKFDEILLSYLNELEKKNNLSMYVQYFLFIIDDKMEKLFLEDRRFCMERLAQFLSPKNDPLQYQLYMQRNQKRNNFIQLAYNQIKNTNKAKGGSIIKQKIIHQPSFKYKSFIILRIIASHAKLTKNQKIISYLREAFLALNDYVNCVELQNIILSLIENQNEWFFIRIIEFFFDRQNWISCAYLYIDKERLNKVLLKQIQPHHKIALQLRNLALLLLSSKYLLEYLPNYERSIEILNKILQKFQLLPQMKQRLLQIKQNCQKSQKYLKIYKQKCNTNEIDIHPLRFYYAYKSTFSLAYKGGYMMQFSLLKEMDNAENFLYQFFSLVEQNSTIMIYQIQKILSQKFTQNHHVQIELFFIYIDNLQLSINLTNLELIHILCVMINGLKNTIFYHQNKPYFDQYMNIQIKDKFWRKIRQKFVEINQLIKNKEFKQKQIPIYFLLFAFALCTYRQKKQNMQEILQKCLKLVRFKDSISSYAQKYCHVFLLEQLLFIKTYFIEMQDKQKYEFNKQFTQAFNIACFKVITYDESDILCLNTEILTTYINIQILLNRSIRTIQKLFLCIMENYGCSETTKQYPIKNSENMFFKCINQTFQILYKEEIQYFVDQVLRKVTLYKLSLNHLMSLFYVYLFVSSRQVKIEMKFQELKKLYIKTNFALKFIRYPFFRSFFIEHLYQNYREIYFVDKQRKNICLLHREVRVSQKQSCLKLSSLVSERIYVRKEIRFNNRQLRNKIEYKFKKSFSKTKSNIT